MGVGVALGWESWCWPQTVGRVQRNIWLTAPALERTSRPALQLQDRRAEQHAEGAAGLRFHGGFALGAISGASWSGDATVTVARGLTGSCCGQYQRRAHWPGKQPLHSRPPTTL